MEVTHLQTYSRIMFNEGGPPEREGKLEGMAGVHFVKNATCNHRVSDERGLKRYKKNIKKLLLRTKRVNARN